MPYRLAKVKGGFKVSGPSGTTYSKKPQSRQQAAAQLRALYANEFKGSRDKS